jgi:hypothetical protein
MIRSQQKHRCAFVLPHRGIGIGGIAAHAGHRHCFADAVVEHNRYAAVIEGSELGWVPALA